MGMTDEQRQFQQAPRPLSYLEAAQLLRRHGIDPSEAFAELGHYPVYDPEEIWSWLPEKSA